MWIKADYVFSEEEVLELLNPIVGKTPGEVNRIMFFKKQRTILKSQE